VFSFLSQAEGGSRAPVLGRNNGAASANTAMWCMGKGGRMPFECTGYASNCESRWWDASPA